MPKREKMSIKLNDAQYKIIEKNIDLWNKVFIRSKVKLKSVHTESDVSWFIVGTKSKLKKFQETYGGKKQGENNDKS